MSTETSGDGTVALVETPADDERTPRKVLGRILPNLVLIRDMGLKHVEFRVQCEVWLTDEAEIAVIEKALRLKTGPELEEARAVVQKNADDAGSKPPFKQILDIAFGDNQNPPSRKQ